MAHAIYNYDGPCSNIHGHSYILHVTVRPAKEKQEKLIAPGFVIDFKKLKEIVSAKILMVFDHKLVLSHEYINSSETTSTYNNLLVFETEPTAENLLLFISRELTTSLPQDITLHSLKLYETNSSYAEWIND
jgi:6-pyruvoyltetrahydropterin/6-carboxytetrahydropterin synthase